jgi:HlyD family secretion protein
MSTLFKLGIFLAIVGSIATAAYRPAMEFWRERNKVVWESVPVTQGDITRSVSTTGNVQPLLKVSVGSFVSGPIVELNVDFNDEVKQGELLAKVDPRLFLANFQQAEATLATRQAELDRVEAQLQQSINNLKRGQRLQKTNEDFLSNREMDALVFEVRSLQAQRRLAKASIQQATAALETSKANLEYTDITSPVDGVVIDRKIDPGQTLAAQFQTPELFIVAPDLRKKVHVFASVNEAYIGLIQKAQQENRPVEFTVEAHPEDLFRGEIEQIRVIGAADQTVVTYKVVIGASNEELKLLPDMTATITFEVDSKQDVVKIPNEALRFVPADPRYVRPEDRKLLDSSRWKSGGLFDNDQSGEADQPEAELSASDKTKAHQDSNTRHVWAIDGDFLRAIEISTGLMDVKYAEVTSGNLQPGDRLVTGQAAKE